MDGSPTELPDLRVFAYTVAEKASLYVALVDVLMAAKERFQLQLRPAEVARHLQETEHSGDIGQDDVTVALEALVAWGNLTRLYDPAAPETLDQFYAKRFLYQLTEAGVAAHEGVRAVRGVGLDGGRLSSVLLPAVADGLRAIAVEAERPNSDPARLYHLFLSLFAACTELADNAARYMDALSVELADVAGDDRSFLVYKRAVFMYLNEFVARLSVQVPEITAAIADLEPAVPRLVELAAGADETPVADGREDDGVLRSLSERWSGVRAWFVASQDVPSISDSLRLAMLDAINRILAALDRLDERHLRRVSREADFTQLARWFADSEGETAHLLWDRAFGLWPARHFTDPSGDEEADPGRSFWDAEPAEVAPRLRAAGTRAGPGRAARAADYRAAKERSLAGLRAAHRQARAATERLAGRTPLRLADLGQLDGHEFAAFLGIIDAALAAAPGPDGTRTAQTALVTVRLRPTSGPAVAEIATPDGILRCADHVLELDLAGGAMPGERVEVATR